MMFIRRRIAIAICPELIEDAVEPVHTLAVKVASFLEASNAVLGLNEVEKAVIACNLLETISPKVKRTITALVEDEMSIL